MSYSKYETIIEWDEQKIYIEEESFTDGSKGFNLVMTDGDGLMRISSTLEDARKLGKTLKKHVDYFEFE